MNYSAVLHSKSIAYVATTLIAYTLWSLWSDRYLVEGTYPFKVSIELNKNQTLQEAPQEITLTLRGLRRSLRSLTSGQRTIRFPAHSLKDGPQLLTLKREYCTLPSRIRIVDHSPIQCSIKTDTVTS